MPFRRPLAYTPPALRLWLWEEEDAGDGDDRVVAMYHAAARQFSDGVRFGILRAFQSHHDVGDKSPRDTLSIIINLLLLLLLLLNFSPSLPPSSHPHTYITAFTRIH